VALAVAGRLDGDHESDVSIYLDTSV